LRVCPPTSQKQRYSIIKEHMWQARKPPATQESRTFAFAGQGLIFVGLPMRRNIFLPSSFLIVKRFFLRHTEISCRPILVPKP